MNDENKKYNEENEIKEKTNNSSCQDNYNKDSNATESYNQNNTNNQNNINNDVNFITLDTPDIANETVNNTYNSNNSNGESHVNNDINNDINNINTKINNTEFTETPNQNNNQNLTSNYSNINEYSNNTQENCNTNNTQENNNPQQNCNTSSTTIYTKKRKKKNKFAPMLALALVFSLIGGGIGGFAFNYFNNSNPYSISKNNNAQKLSIDLNNISYYASAVYEKNKDKVVGISTTSVRSFESFFGGRQQQEIKSIGSGVIINSNGLILTNSHVVADGSATEITVSLYDGSSEKATILWNDKILDLAVIKINKTNLPFALLGDSNNVIVGEPVLAMGNPMSLDFSGTTTDGIISGLNRSITIDGNTIKPLIQTNASINPGNSGGPLFNAKGEVIGINTAKLSNAEGIGFSIPINTAKNILDQLENDGKVSRVYLGITFTSIENYERLMQIETNQKSGIVITNIIKNSPIEATPIKKLDIITAIDNEKVTANNIARILYNYKPGDKATITYISEQKEHTTEITFTERPSNY